MRYTNRRRQTQCLATAKRDATDIQVAFGHKYSEQQREYSKAFGLIPSHKTRSTKIHCRIVKRAFDVLRFYNDNVIFMRVA